MQVDTSCYLVLHSGSDGFSRNIAIVDSLARALSGWTSCSRISPIWPVTGLSAARKGQHFAGKTILTFLGPCQPARLTASVALLTSPNVLGFWLTSGCFNMVVCTDDSAPGETLSKAVTDFATKNELAFEQWRLDNGVIRDATYQTLKDNPSQSLLDRLAKFTKSDSTPEIRSSFQEPLVATATSLARAAAVSKPLYADLSEVAEVTCKIMDKFEAEELSISDMQSRLMSLNAALSRFSSQAFSGIPPIRETECHFWIHSLLGTGSANIALANLVASVQTTLGEARIPQRLQQLENLGNAPSLDQLNTGSDLLNFDLMVQASLPAGRRAKVEPLVTYFSGRDGFSSHVQTLSAPLTTLAECNSYRSNLLTVTHEISHIFVQSALAELAPTPGDPKDLAKAQELLSPRYKAQNYLDAARQLFLEAIVGMKGAGQEEFDFNTQKEELDSLLQETRHEVQEILVHTFDFLYFHAGDPDYYVTSIWHSWCSIPGIADRVPDYLMRTLCAVSANLLNHEPGRRFEAALLEVKRLLESIEGKIGQPQNYVSKALSYIAKLEKDPALKKRIGFDYDMRIYLVRLVKIFLFSETLSAQLYNDPHVSGGRSGYRSKKSLVYDTQPIGNYLLFLKGQLKKDPSEAESIWVLHCLAFDKTSNDGQDA